MMKKKGLFTLVAIMTLLIAAMLTGCGGKSVDISDATKIVAITADTFLKLPYSDGRQRYTYVVTALDRMSNESKAVKKKIKL